MIHNYTVKNFYSIGDKIEVDLESRKESINAPELYLDASLDKKVTKIEFVGGPNASGKTNVLRALAFLRFMIVDSASQTKKGEDMSFQPFYPHKDRPTELSVSFSIKGDSCIYKYLLKLDTKKILHEQLDKTYFKKERSTTANIFERKWVSKERGYDVKLTDDMPTIKQVTSINSLLKNNNQVSFISLLNNFDSEDGLLRKITMYWDGVVSNTLMIGSTESEFSLTQYSEAVLRDIFEQKELCNSVSDILRKYDIGFSKIEKKDKLGPNQDQTIYGIFHEYKGTQFGMSMHGESNGTKRIIILMRDILAAMAVGGVAVIDEIDAFLHPDIYDEIIAMFMSTETNKNNAQLIFSSHNYTTLANLDKQQITLTQKSEAGQTEVWRLDDMQGIRPDDNFYTKYLTGAYGATPKIG
jgi:AAA15 family ATPase/GTPase